MNSSKRLSVAASVAALALFGAVLFGGVADAAKKTKKTKTATAKGSVGAVPQGPTAGAAIVPFKGTAKIGKKFKKNVIGDVNVTISATGTPAAGSTSPIGDLVLKLTAPNGTTVGLAFGLSGGIGAIPGSLSGTAVTNLVYDDETPTLTCGLADPPAPQTCLGSDPDATLLPPYTGKASPGGGLSRLDFGPMKGTWTLTAFDRTGDLGDQGVNSITAWSISVKPAAPVS